MGAQITLSLPADVLENAELWASRAGRPLADFLADTLEQSLRPLGPPPDADRPIATWTNEEVLAAADAMMPPEEDSRLSELLYRQQAGQLAGAERGELDALMQVYRHGLLRKARAWREAVQRGLREPLRHE